VFYTSEWALAMQSAYQTSSKPLLLLGYEGEELVGVASFATDPAGQHVNFLSATTADYCDFISCPQNRREFVNAVLSEIRTVNAASIALANLPDNSATITALEEVRRDHGLHLHRRPAYCCTQIELGTAEQREELRSALLRKKKLRRYLRELEREGPITVVHLQSAEKIHRALPGFADAHVARFRATNRTSSLSTPERRVFLEELAKRFADAPVVTLSMLMVGERPLAWNYGFQFQGTWFWYMPTFDSRQQQNSPGHCLLCRIVADACEDEEIKLVDLGLGAEGYKERFGNSVRNTTHVTLTHSSLRHLREVVRYRAVSVLRQSPRIENVARRMLHRTSQEKLGDVLAN